MNRRARISLTLGLSLSLALSVLTANGSNAQTVAGGGLTPLQKRHVSGAVSVILDSEAAGTQAQAQATVQGLATLGASTATNNGVGPSGKCDEERGPNVKVNQDCLNLSGPGSGHGLLSLQGPGQAQNETAIAQDPNAPNHLVASFNDYRRGDIGCGTAWSVDGGQTWHDSTLPTGFVSGAAYGGVARQYFHKGADTSVAWDSRGNAYFSCLMLMRRGAGTTNNPDQSSGVYLFRSTGSNGGSWNSTGRPVVEDFDVTGNTLEDKPYMTVDNNSSSRFRDRIYVTWTEYLADGTGYIWSEYSNDYGENFSARVLVSGTSPFCTNTFGAGTPQGNCNANSYSQPFTGPDGSLYVVYANYNNQAISGLDNRYQVLLVKSKNGGASFSTPVKVADYYDLPDCATYQGLDAGNGCIPEKGNTTNSIFRAGNYPSGGVDPTNASRVVVAFGSYIGPHSNDTYGNKCAPNGFSGFGNPLYTGVKAPGGCKNDILVSVSNDYGVTFTGGSTDPRYLSSAAPTTRQATSSQWFQWLAFTKNGKLAVSYYDRQYGSDETTGFSDISVAGSRDFSHFGVTRVTSSSMPPPTQLSGTFWGDYAGLAALDQAHPIWSDTRAADLFLCPNTGVPGIPPAVCTMPAPNAAIANDQDIYTDSTGVPSPGE